jgi:hypothetical protein
MILNALGRPEPPSGVVARLREISPLLDLRLIQVPVAGELRQWWGVVGQWRPDDPRRQSVRSGEVGAESAYDLVAQLPLDCAPDEAPAYLARQVAERSDDTRKFLRDVHDWNAKQTRAVVAEGGDHMEQLVSDHITEVSPVVKVYQGGRAT